MKASWIKRICMLITAGMLLCALPAPHAAAAEAFTEVGGWNESIFATISGVTDAQVTGVSYSGKVSGTLTGEDFTYLVRDTDDGVRIDIPGLTPGSYTLTVHAAGKTYTQSGITVTAYDRSGYAHFNYTAGVGAYNDDGTLKDNAVVLYVTQENKNSVTVTAKDGTKVSGIGNILNSAGADTTGNGTTSKGGKANTNSGIIKKLAEDGTPLVVRIVGNVTAPAGVTAYASADYGGGVTDNGYMAKIQSGKHITIEGIGTDACINGWGLSFICQSGAPELGKSFEVRNIAFRNVPEDCVGMEGKMNETTLIAPVERCWVHHCSFYAPTIANPAEADKAGGDGACDFKLGQYFTNAYCHYSGYHKTGLVGGGDSQLQYHLTYHHNYWENCESRAPLARQANIHMYNNVYSGQSSYCMSLRANTYIFTEYSMYINSKRITDGNAGGVAKSYNNRFVNCTGTTNSDLVIVSDKTAKVSSKNLYANFDTDPELSYIPTGDYYLQTDVDEVYETVLDQAGPQKGKEEPVLPPVLPEAGSDAEIHNFTVNNLSSTFYTFTSCNTSTGKGTVSLGGLTMTTCLKMEGATSVSFQAPSDGTLLLVFHESGLDGIAAPGQTVKLNDTAYKVAENNAVTIPVKAGENILKKGSAQIFLYYMAYIPKSEPAPALGIYGKSLLLEDIVRINYYFTLENMTADQIKESGLQVWNAADFPGANAALTAESATYIVEGLTVKNGYYTAMSDGIPAKNMGDLIYARGYAVLDDGTVAYSDVIEYSAATYAQNQYNKTTITAELRALVTSLMNYGAAAQLHFGYDTGNLMNSFLTAGEQEIVWDASFLNVSAEDAAGKYALQTEDASSVIAKINKSVSLEGALAVNLYATLGITDPREVGILYWDAETYAVADALTAENAVKLPAVVNGSYRVASVEGVAAKNTGDSAYACVYVIDAEGNTHYSELVCYNAHNYAASQIAKNQNPKLVALCKAMVIYGNAAKVYFTE